ncbi:MAG: hypothetical protein U0271_04940 [Polyangiaceae bacterium]
MSTFILRNQGFFYTDEYFAPLGAFKQVFKKVFKTRAEAEQARAKYARRWLRQHPLHDFYFDDRKAVAAIVGYLKSQWPDLSVDDTLFDVSIPKKASDEQVDEILRLGGVEFVEVFEVQASKQPVAKKAKAKPAPVEEDEDDDEDGDGEEEDDTYWGPSFR